MLRCVRRVSRLGEVTFMCSMKLGALRMWHLALRQVRTSLVGRADT